MIPDPTPELRAEFVENAGPMISQLRIALERGRRDEIRRIAHKLRGSAGTFGLAAAGATATEIEAVALGAEMSALASAIDRLAGELMPTPPSEAPGSPSRG
jgi:HPt (histidine-containing phosphotransfer) domain-containing protein